MTDEDWPKLGQTVSNGFRGFTVIGFDKDNNPICQPTSGSFKNESWPMSRQDLVRGKQ